MYHYHYAYKCEIFTGGRYSGYDYYINSYYSVRIPAGATNMSFSIQIYDDSAIEGYETFNIYISTDLIPNNVRVGSHSRATVTIVDDDCE